MVINVRIEAHAYSEDEIRNDYFNDQIGYGIAGPDAMAPLDKVRNHIFEYEYDENTSLREFRSIIERSIWGYSSSEGKPTARFYYVFNKHRYSIGTPTANFKNLLNKYFDPDNSGLITVCFLVSHNAGIVGPKNGPLRFYYRSHESGKHHLPHVHVRDTGYQYEASIRLIDGEIQEGFLPPKLAKLAKKEIMSNQANYYTWWNEKTDGLLVDLENPF